MNVTHLDPVSLSSGWGGRVGQFLTTNTCHTSLCFQYKAARQILYIFTALNRLVIQTLRTLQCFHFSFMLQLNELSRILDIHQFVCHIGMLTTWLEHTVLCSLVITEITVFGKLNTLNTLPCHSHQHLHNIPCGPFCHSLVSTAAGLWFDSPISQIDLGKGKLSHRWH